MLFALKFINSEGGGGGVCVFANIQSNQGYRKHIITSFQITRNLPKFSYIKVLESWIDSAHFSKRVVSIGQLLTEIIILKCFSWKTADLELRGFRNDVALCPFLWQYIQLGK